MCVDMQSLQGPLYTLKKHAASSGIDLGAAKMDGRVIETRTFRSLSNCRQLGRKRMQSGRSTTEPHAPGVSCIFNEIDGEILRFLDYIPIFEILSGCGGHAIPIGSLA
jgi:hypothetical protein